MLRIWNNSLSSLRSIKMLVNFNQGEGYEVGLQEEPTAFSEAFRPDTRGSASGWKRSKPLPVRKK